MTTFHNFNLHASLLKALDAMDIDTPTPVQRASIPPLLDGRDVIAQAPTGSGKTLAFALPMLERIDVASNRPQALVITPTRELAQQVAGVVQQLLADRKARVALVFGGRAIGPQQDTLRKGAPVVVGTPGRLVDLLERGSLRLDEARYVVLDEADEMLDRGFAQDVERLLRATSHERQTALFSATTPEWVHKISAKYLHEPEVIAAAAGVDAEPDIDHVVYEVWGGDKFSVLCTLLEEPADGATLVFGRTKHGVRKLGDRLRRRGYSVGVLQGNLTQQQRDRVMGEFRRGKTPVLLATNVAARGLDVLHIERVINYELPETYDLFTHRVGRTARMGRSGRAITLLGPADLPKWHEIERGLGRKLPRMTPDGKVIQPQQPKRSNGSGPARKQRFQWRRPAGVR